MAMGIVGKHESVVKCPATFVYPDGNTLGIGYDNSTGAPVIITATTPRRLIGVAFAQVGEAVSTQSGWYHVNDSGKWSQEDDLNDCGQFVRTFEPDDFTYVPETPAHLVDDWAHTARVWADRGGDDNKLHAAELYAVAAQLAWTVNAGDAAKHADDEANRLSREVLKAAA